jgi:non-ribosomal peptide synthetase component F
LISPGIVVLLALTAPLAGCSPDGRLGRFRNHILGSRLYEHVVNVLRSVIGVLGSVFK